MTSPNPLPAASLADLTHHLIALHPDASARLLPVQARGSADADWIIGIKAIVDDASVHAGHWERHPRGEEVLCLLDGQVLVTLKAGAQAGRKVWLSAGQMLVVPRGQWHRLQVERPGRLMFVTPSVGSEHRRVDVSVDGEPA